MYENAILGSQDLSGSLGLGFKNFERSKYLFAHSILPAWLNHELDQIINVAGQL